MNNDNNNPKIKFDDRLIENLLTLLKIYFPMYNEEILKRSIILEIENYENIYIKEDRFDEFRSKILEEIIDKNNLDNLKKFLSIFKKKNDYYLMNKKRSFLRNENIYNKINDEYKIRNVGEIVDNFNDLKNYINKKDILSFVSNIMRENNKHIIIINRYLSNSIDEILKEKKYDIDFNIPTHKSLGERTSKNMLPGIPEPILSKHKKHPKLEEVIKILSHPFSNTQKIHKKYIQKKEEKKEEYINLEYGTEEMSIGTKTTKQMLDEEKESLMLLEELKKKIELDAIVEGEIEPIFYICIKKSFNDLKIASKVSGIGLSQILNDEIIRDYFSRYVSGYIMCIYMYTSGLDFGGLKLPIVEERNSFKLKFLLEEMKKSLSTVFPNISLTSKGIVIDTNAIADKWQLIDKINLESKIKVRRNNKKKE